MEWNNNLAVDFKIRDSTVLKTLVGYLIPNKPRVMKKNKVGFNSIDLVSIIEYG